MLSTAAADKDEALRMANEQIAAQAKEIDDLKTSLAAKRPALKQMGALIEKLIFLEEQSRLVEEKEASLLAQAAHLDQRSYELAQKAARVSEQEGRIHQQTQLYAAYMMKAQLEIRNYQAREQVMREALDGCEEFLEAAKWNGPLDPEELYLRFETTFDEVERVWQQEYPECEYS